MARRPIRAGALAALGVGLLSLEAAAIYDVAPRVSAMLEGERGSALARATVHVARTVALATSHQATDLAGGLALRAVRRAAQAYALMLSVTPHASAARPGAPECGAVPCAVPGPCPSTCGAPAVDAPAPTPEGPVERGAS